ncbi:NAD(P)-binding domain-containing protein [Hansschlegelia beijingensis]
MEIGFIGLGSMGSAMARNLVAAGHRVRAWNRSGGAIEGVAMLGAPAEAFDADAVMTMLSDDAAIRSVILDAGVLAAARPGLTNVVCSTISVAFARELAAAHERAGIGFVSAPVLGRPDALYADQGTWTRLQRNGMATDVSWAASAKVYAQLFRDLVP